MESNENNVFEAETKETQINKSEVSKAKRSFGIGTLCAFLVFGGVCSFGGAYVATNFMEPVKTAAVEDSVANGSSEGTTQVVYVDESGNYTTSEVAAMVADSVVVIQTEYVTTSTYWGNYVSSGAGSGVILSSDGYIVTNHHVIENATTITVTLNNGSSYKAELVGSDATSDIAILKIDATGLKSATLGDSDNLVVGQDVIAVGNPLGTLGGTVTEGIISAKDREVTIDSNTMTLLQTTAAINPGNSGGGLFNMKGELIGIVNAKSSSNSETIEGLGFAIPVNTAKGVITDLMTYGYVTGRPQLGISAYDVSNYYTAMRLGVNTLGVYVYQVTVDNSALQAGDLIVQCDDTMISSYADLSAFIKQHEIGDTIKVQVYRDGKLTSVEVTLTEYAPETTKSQTQEG